MLPTTFILIFVFLLLGILFFFYLKNKHVKQGQKQCVRQLEQQIEGHREQITIRNRNLTAYNFLKYNLDEALLVQESIKL